ncbi:MAG: hypothetical protein ACK5Q5_16245 [Planctomycetaceae bacterium]
MFRVTQQQMLWLSQQQAARQNIDVLRRQGQISSGQRIQRPSDDPAGQAAVLRQQALVSRLQAKGDNIGAIRARLTTTYQSVSDAHELIVRAKTLALDARQVSDPQSVEVLALEIDSLLTQMQTIANTYVQGTAVFGGADLMGAPFGPSNGSTWDYLGSVQPGLGRLDGEVPLLVQPVGVDVFQPDSTGQALFLGDTGAAAGSGANSIRGVLTLSVRHTLTTFAAGSGVQPGLDTASDTVLGPNGANVLTIDDVSGTGAAGTVALNGGPTVAFTSGDTNLVVTGPDGEVVHLDMAAITPGFSGTVGVTGEGTLSIDGGETVTPITFTANQLVVDSRDGRTLHVDASGTRRAGSETVDLVGTADAFQVLAHLRDDLRNQAGLSGAERDAAIGRRLDDLDRVAEHLRDVMGEQSISLERLDDVESRTSQLLLDARSRLAETAETDLPEALLALQSAQMQWQFSLATAAQLFNTTVLNFLK